MTKSTTRPAAEAAPARTDRLPSPAAIRETIEQAVFVFLAVFLFRAFAADAFVIPTGSMAPTLMGRHKDVVCPKCGYSYEVSASEEVDQEGTPYVDRNGRSMQIQAGTCPMCRYTALLGKDNPQHKSYPSCNGDRIEVSKIAYQFSEPQRWDVLVFLFPGDPEAVPAAQRMDSRNNFIKRLVGLPGETIRIEHGNVWVRRGDEPFHIARKPPEKLLAMLQPVFDNDYMPRIAKHGWPARWQCGAAGWASDDGATFHTDGAGGNWLRYHHLVPTYSQWQEAEAGFGVPALSPQLITDFTAYDTRQFRTERPAPELDGLGVHWVGDLAVACSADVENDSGELKLELYKGGRQFQCAFDVATGRATLSISGPEMKAWRPAATTSLRGKGRHTIRFSNCDDELLLWVDGRLVQFDSPTTYADLGNTRPDGGDLAPVGIASQGAKLRIEHLRVFRDIYYGAVRGEGMLGQDGDVHYRPDRARPDEGFTTGAPDHFDFPLASDQFFVLGDNSACSKDGRLWGHDNYWVPRDLLVGKALLISWPRSSCSIPYVDVPIPYFPNVSRMGRIR